MTIPLPTTVQPLLLTGHVIDKLREMPNECVACVVTSPPYWGLRIYDGEPQIWGGDPNCRHEFVAAPKAPHYVRGNAPGDLSTSSLTNPERQDEISRPDGSGSFCGLCEGWRGDLGLEPTPQLYVAHLVEVFREVRRVLRKDGTVWLNLGDSYSGYHGNSRVPDELAPSNKPGYVENMRKTTVGTDGLKPKDLVGIPWRVAFALRDDGWWLRSDIIWGKPNGMPSSVTDRPTSAHEYVFLLTKSSRYFYDCDAVRTEYSAATMPEIGENYTGMSTKAFREYRAQDASDAKRSMIDALDRHDGANLKSVWSIPTHPYPGAHFATMPPELARRCILLGTSEHGGCAKCGSPWKRITDREHVGNNASERETPSHPRIGMRFSLPPNDAGKRSVATIDWEPTCECGIAEVVPQTVLDPFSGSGTTCAVARRYGRYSIGIDLSPEYTEQAEDRPEVAAPSLGGDW